MNKYTILFAILFLSLESTKAQQEVVTGSLDTKSESSIIIQIASTEDHYYFVTHNFIGDKRPTSLFKTTLDFELVESIETLLIRGAEVEYLSFFEIFSDRILMVSNAETESGSYIYTHSLDLNFGTHTVLDSIPKNIGEEFTTFEYKRFDGDTFFTIGNISRSNITEYLSTNYFEFDIQGNINKLETIADLRSPALTFDYNPDTETFFTCEVNTFNLVSTNFEIINTRSSRLPIPLPGFVDIVMNISSCNYTDMVTVECIGSSLGPAGIYSNFAAYFDTTADTILYENVIQLHSDTIENERTRFVKTTEDGEGNRYFAYFEPFNPIDLQVSPNKIFISKFDKDLNNIYLLEFLDSQEHGFEDIHVDQQGNLIVAGATLTTELGIFNNSYIKISENGELLTNTGSISLPQTVDIYPNPTTDFITLNIDLPSTDINYFIYTVDGRIATYGNIPFGNKLSVDTQALPVGIYILNIEYDGRIRTAKFVKK